MKVTNYLTAGLVAISALVASVHGQVTTSSSDLILGFRATSGTGSDQNLEVDLGSISNYTSVSGKIQVTRLAAADLTAVYGSNWSSNSTLVWGVAAAAGATNKIIYLTQAESTPGTQTSAYPSQIQSLRNAAGSLIQGASGGLNGQASLSNAFTAKIAASDPTSWTTNEGPAQSAAFGFVDLAQFENSASVASGSYTVSDLWKFSTNNSLTYIGSFGLDSSGTLWFSNTASSFATAVPEPSTYAAIVGALALGLVVIRRRRQAAAA